MTEQTSIRIGVLVPEGNTVHAAELERLRPEGVTFKVLGFGYPPMSDNFCIDLVQTLKSPIEALKAWGAAVILLGCTAASMTCASDSFVQQLETIAEVPVVTAAGAAGQAIAALGADQLAVATPYGATNNGVVQAFLVKSGVTVAAIAGLDLDRSPEAWAAGQPTLTPDKVFDLACSVNTEAAQGLYLPCTAMGSLDAIDRFEKAFDKPALSSVQAGFWAALRRAGIDGRQGGAGRLLQQWDF